MKIYFSVLILVLFAACTNPYTKGLKHYNQGQYTEAIELFKKALKSDSANGEIFEMIGHSFHQLQNYPEAVDYYEKAIDLGIYKFEVYNNMGDAYHKVGKDTSAAASFLIARQIQPDAQMINYNLAVVYNSLGEYEKTINFLTTELKNYPNDFDALCLRAEIYNAIGQYEEAYSDIEKALRLKEDPETYFIRGLISFNTKKYDSAYSDFSKAIDMDSEEAEYYIKRSAASGELGQYDKAVEDAKRAITIDSINSDGYYTLALGYYKMGQKSEACTAYKKYKSLTNASDLDEFIKECQ